jgi:hypothetical protein
MTKSICGPLARALVSSAIMLMTVLPVAAQDCPQLLGRWPFGTARAVAVSGSLALVGSGTTMLVLDVSTPSSPQLLGSVTLPEQVYGIAAAGSHAYVANGMSGLRVIDVSNPAAPVEVGVSDVTNEGAVDVAVAGSHAYVAYGSLGLRVIDVSEPSLPGVVGAIDTPGTAMGVAVAGSHAYVADGSSGLRAISIANPAAPVEVGALDTPGYAYGSAVAGNHAYVADGTALRVISIANPAAPVESGSFSTGNTALKVAVSGSLAFVAEQYNGVRLVDVSNPAAPVGRGYLDGFGGEFDIAVAAGLAYVTADWEGMLVGEFSDPDAPTIVGTYRTAGESVSVTVAGSLAYVGAFAPAVRVMDLSMPAAPVEVGWLEVEDTPLEIAISGTHAFVAELTAGLRVLDLSNPLEPVSVALLETPGRARGVALAGALAYVADDSAGLVVIYVSNPAAPVQVGVVDTPGLAYGVAVAGGYAFVADESAGLTVVDVRIPTAPSVVATAATPDDARDVIISGNHAYVAATQSGLRVVDISAPAAPHEVGFLSGVVAEGVAVDGTWAYIAGGGGVVVVDVSDPSQPVEVGSYDTPGTQPGNLAIFDGTLVVADDDAGVAVFDDCQGGAPLSHISYIPAAAVAAGAQGAFFQTDLEINNTGTEEAQVTFQWLPRGEDNSEPMASELYDFGPGESVRFDNVLTELFGLEPDSVGALKLVANSSSVIAMSRTYNIPAGKAAGTFGQGLPAIRSTEMITGTDPQRIIFLSEDPDSRANVGCVNGSGEDVQISIAMYNARGELLDTRTMALGPYSNNQINRIFRDFQPVKGYVDVTADSDDALYYCYGSMLDNSTSDPTTILPQVPSADTTFIPAAALAAGLAGAFFETDVDLNNAGAASLTYRLLWLPRGADNSDPVQSQQFSLAAGASVRYANVLDSVFGLDPDQVGALAVEASSFELLAMSRTYNLPSAEAAGTFGQELPGIPDDRMIRSGVKKRIIFMNENADVRSNVGCVNGSDEAAVVSLQLFNAEGVALETKSMNLPPYSNNQITRVFRTHAPISAGYVDVWATTPYASIYCYGSVLDNSTSDPTTVLPQ